MADLAADAACRSACSASHSKRTNEADVMSAIA
jgi:hypothetical protein